MMVKKLIIKNFRSIRNIEIELSELNVFIGPNNAGKSNIMKALNLVLGESYPSIRSFNDKDFYNYDKSRPIEIKVMFDSPLQCNPNVYGFGLTFDGDDCSYLALDSQGNTLTYPYNNREIRVSSNMKDEVSLLYLGLERQASQQIRPTQWTLYGKLLRHIERQISDSKKRNFKDSVENSFNAEIFPALQMMEDILRNHVRSHIGLDLKLRLSTQDPIEAIKNLRPYLKEGTGQIEFDAEDMGAGTQSALAIAVARAYAKIVRQPLIIIIEEPELYLHPHGCRHFYKLLKRLGEEGIQIFYTTHERSFVNAADFRRIYLVRKSNMGTSIYSGIHIDEEHIDEIKMASKFNEEINEVFFANHVVLVEGPADKIACKMALEKLGVELDKEGISIVECGSNTNVKPFAKILTSFSIPAYALIDEDPGNTRTQSIIEGLKQQLGNNLVFLQSPNLEGIFGLQSKPNKQEAIEIFTNWFNANEVPIVYKELKSKMGL